MKIFISYASEQRDTAQALQLGLLGYGHEVFFDRDALTGGARYLSLIDEGIRACDLFVFLVSPESVAPGRFTLSELEIARRKWPHPRGHVMPVLALPTPMTAIPTYLKAVTLLEPRGNLVADVVHAVQYDLAEATVEPPKGSESADAGKAPPVAAHGLPWWRAAVLALVLPLLLLGVNVVLVRLDILRAETLNYVPPLGLLAAVLVLAWTALRRR